MVSQPLGRVVRQAVPKFGAVASHSGVQGGNGCPVLLPIVCQVAGRRWTGRSAFAVHRRSWRALAPEREIFFEQAFQHGYEMGTASRVIKSAAEPGSRPAACLTRYFGGSRAMITETHDQPGYSCHPRVRITRATRK